jgi:phosphoglycolate phosphatase
MQAIPRFDGASMKRDAAKERGEGWRCVVFDLDGTLLDTRDAMLHAINALLARLERRAVATEELQHATHEGLESMLRLALSLTGQSPGTARLAEFHAQVSAEYLGSTHPRIRMFPDLLPLLEALSQRGVWMAVCTNQLEAHAYELLRHFGLTRYFSSVVGRNTFAVRKPHPLPLIWLVGRCGVAPHDALMIGDSLVDAECATNAGVAVILMEHGYGLVQKHGAYVTTANFKTLHARIDSQLERSIEESSLDIATAGRS